MVITLCLKFRMIHTQDELKQWFFHCYSIILNNIRLHKHPLAVAVLKESQLDISLPFCMEVPIQCMPCLWHMPSQVGELLG